MSIRAKMIKMMKRIFFYAAFVLCTAFVFAADGEDGDVSAVKVYDAKDTLVCALMEDADIKAVISLLKESIASVIDNAAFTQVPENTVIAYRYDIRGTSFADTQLVIYADGKTAYIPNMLEDIPEVFVWELFEDAYKILSQPDSLKEGLARYKNSGETICVYDAKGVLVSSVRIQSVAGVLSKILTDYTDDTKRRRASGSFLSTKSVHEDKRLLYRYTVWGGEDDETIRIYIYEDTGKAVMAGRFPNVMDCTLSKEGYALFKNPKKLIEKLEATAGQLPDIR